VLKHQRRAWRRGEQARVETYLAQQPSLRSESDAVLDLIYNEIVLREEAGEVPQLGEYLDRFPQFAAELRLQFEVEEAIRLGRLDESDDDPTLAVRNLADRASHARPVVPGYEVLEELGRGGMGVVYRARQVRLNRIVALKTILAGDHATPEAAVRFLAEAEAVARLQHPNIVQIFAFGEHEGRPYFEMEYVPGGNLAARMNGKEWVPKDAARLVETLARAIHEVHKLGIVHRDLKPANILLSAEGDPKIADFGLAKWLNVETGLTRSQWIVGSPHYMAPEQAGAGSGVIGPAADVYSLGAILYELLTGQPPFRAATVLETLEQVKRAVPVIPTRLRAALPRDLVTICLKCLEKEPARRYAGADILAEDLRRFCAGEPIQARPLGRTEKVWRWCRREPALALLALSLIIGLVGVTTQWRRAESHLREAIEQGMLARANELKQLRANRALIQAKDRETTALRRAQGRFDAAMKTFGEFKEITDDAALLREPRLEGLRVKLLRTALDFYRELQASLEADASPEARSQLAEAYAQVGQVNWDLGRPEEALAAIRHSLALTEQMAAASPDEPRVMNSLGRAHARMGYTFRTMGRPAEALRSYERARAIQEELARDHPAIAHYREVLSWTLSNLGVSHLELGHPEEAIRFHGRAVSIHEGLVARDPLHANERGDLAWGWRYLSQALAASGDLDEALRLAERAAELCERVVGEGEANTEARWRLARCLDEVGRIRVLLGRPSDAALPLERAAGMLAAVDSENPVRYGVDVVRNQLYLALQRESSGRSEDARACIRRAESVLARPSKLSPDLLLFDLACGYSLWSVAGTEGTIDPEEREPRARRAVAALRRAAASGRVGPDQLRRDPVLAPLRPRADFQELLLDLSFPADPFGGTIAGWNELTNQ
jgi:serine/threonine-protein kinase